MAFDNWLTDPSVLDLVRQAMGSIDFDPASNFIAQEYVKAKHYCVTLEDFILSGEQNNDTPPGCHINGLMQNWRGNVFCNPPYSAGNIDRFVDKGIEEWERFNSNARLRVGQMIFLVNSSTDCAWYHKLLNNCSIALLWRGRIKFWKIFDGKAHEKWEGQKSKEQGLGKIGNSPRYLSTLFYFGSNSNRFKQAFNGKGTFIQCLE